MRPILDFVNFHLFLLLSTDVSAEPDASISELQSARDATFPRQRIVVYCRSQSVRSHSRAPLPCTPSSDQADSAATSVAFTSDQLRNAHRLLQLLVTKPISQLLATASGYSVSISVLEYSKRTHRSATGIEQSRAGDLCRVGPCIKVPYDEPLV